MKDSFYDSELKYIVTEFKYCQLSPSEAAEYKSINGWYLGVLGSRIILINRSNRDGNYTAIGLGAPKRTVDFMREYKKAGDYFRFEVGMEPSYNGDYRYWHYEIKKHLENSKTCDEIINVIRNETGE